MYDLIIIGGGPAGYHGALKAAHSGLKTALITDDAPGGVCLHSGCIPTKTVLHTTKLAMDHAPFAIYGGSHPIDFPVLKERTNGITTTLSKGISFQLKRAGVELFTAEAEIYPKRDSLFAVKAGANIVMAHNLLLATGSQQRPLNIPGSDSSGITTIKKLLNAEQAPNSLLIIGAGAVGIEMAVIFARAGTEVTLVEKADSIIPHFDRDLTKLLTSALTKEKITVYTDTTVESIKQKTATLRSGDEEFTVQCEQILPAMGRIPRVAVPGIANLSVEMNGYALAVDDRNMTTEPNCYAAGDLTGTPMLAHSAYYEAEVAVAAIAGAPMKPLRELFVPSVLYSSPELASVGITEAEAKELELPVIVKRRPLGGNGRFLAETAGERGMCKIILHETSGSVLGIHLAAPHASEVITAAAIIVQQKLTAEDLASIIFPHPTIGEIIKQTIVEE